MRDWCSLHGASEAIEVRAEQQPATEEQRKCSRHGECEDKRNDLWGRLLIRTENVVDLLLRSITLRRSISWQITLIILPNLEREDFRKQWFDLAEGADDEAGFERLCQQGDWELRGREVQDGAAGIFDGQGVCGLETGRGGEEEVCLMWARCGRAGLCC